MRESCPICSRIDILLTSGICIKCGIKRDRLKRKNDIIVRALGAFLVNFHQYDNAAVEYVFDSNNHPGSHDEKAIEILVQEIKDCENAVFEAHQDRIQTWRESEARF